MSEPVAKLVPVNDPVQTDLYEVRRTIYPRAVHGWFANWRWSLVFLTQAVFYGLPWLTINGRQAVLFDLGSRKFYVFGHVFWPQDFIFLTALLIISALSLFLFTAVAGRLWCGYACPQTVYTEIFLWIERKIEGDRVQRMKLDRAGFDLEKLVKKVFKHIVWISFALWTGFTFVGYFTPMPVLMMEFIQTRLGPWESFWIVFYAFATYGNAGWMREQVCKYMCPYARFQSVMFDRDTLVITYDAARGEPRGARSRTADYQGKGLGACVDCGICVQVCPTGIDIRRGLQYECIGCAACIDGCNTVMDKMGYPRGLIRYSTDNAVKGKYSDRAILSHVMRPRTLIYGAILLAIIGAFLTTLYLRVPLKVDVMRDRTTLVRVLADGRLENVYRLQIMNTTESARRFTVTASGIDGIEVLAELPAAVPAAGSIILPVALRADPAKVGTGSQKVIFRIEDVDDPRVSDTEKSSFISTHNVPAT